MKHTLFIDPGARDIGWAVYYGLTLHTCGAASTKKARVGERVAELAAQIPYYLYEGIYVEHMVWYPGLAKSMPKDLLMVQAVGVGLACYLADAAEQVHTIKPSDWKADIPKHVHHPRLYRRYSEEERWILDDGMRQCSRKKLREEVQDAAGMGLSVLGRTSKEGRAR